MRIQTLGRLAITVALAACAHSARAERTFVGILEADSYQSVIYGASAFSRVAELPVALELINATLMKNLSLPSFNGVSSTDLLRVVQTVDPTLPLADGNPANVALVPLSDTGTTVLQAFSAAYEKRSEKGHFLLFENPKDTNLASRVAVAVTGHTLITSASREALVWAWDNRTRLIDAPPQSIPGTLRVLVNPQRLADILGTRSEKASSVVNLDKLIRDFGTLSFSLTLEGQAVTLTLRGKPAAGSALQALQAALRPPAARLWNGSPDNAFFTSLSACDNPQLWNTYLGESHLQLLRPVTGLAPQASFTGDRLLYLAPTKSKQGLCFVQVEPVKDAESVRQAIQKLHTLKTNDGIELTRKPQRLAGNLQIESYEVTVRPPEAPTNGSKPEDPSLMLTMASLFLKQAVLDATVTDGHLITVLGPAETLEDELPNLAFREKALPLSRKIGLQNTALDSTLYLGASLNVADLLRHIVSIMPGVKPEHLRVLSTGGDGATFGISRSDDQTLTASLRIHTNEIAALQRMNRDGREVLQELFFQIFSSQMMHQQAPPVETKK